MSLKNFMQQDDIKDKNEEENEDSDEVVIYKLQQKNIKLQEERRYIIFYCILWFVICFDMCMFSHINNWCGCLCIGIIEIIGIIITGNKLNITDISLLVDKIFDIFNKK